MKKHFPNAEKYQNAIRLFEEMDRMRRVWHTFHPEPPLKRSDLAALGTVEKLSQQGNSCVSVGMLAKALHQSMPGISQKLKVLENEGYLRRVNDKEDRRLTYVELTGKGKKAATYAMQEFLGRMERALEQLGTQKTDNLLQAMSELSDAIAMVQKK